jgi:hypothetical protein
LSERLGSVEPMRAIDLEAKVISAVDRIRAGQSVEHDLVECKRDWPQDKKARQLAGSLNRAGGDPVIYIIGIDEDTGEVHDVSGTEVADWWNQITPKFDQLPPEMVRHISVPVGDNGEHVIAVAFASDRAPYVVKTGGANPSLEVPVREGTGTRTARRDELLRLLIPTAAVPSAVVLRASFRVEHHPAVAERRLESGQIIRGQAEDIYTSGSLRIYFEHNGRELVTMPAHGIRGRVLVDGEAFGLKVRQAPGLTNYGGSTNLTMAPPPDGVMLTGPRAVSLDIEAPGLSVDDLFEFEFASQVTFEVDLDVLHASRPLTVSVTMNRETDSDGGGATDYQRPIGAWSFGHPALGE